MNGIGFQRISFFQEEQIGFLEFNCPRKRNALDEKTFDELLIALDLISEKNLRALILRGVGSDFCAGFDLKLAARDQRVLEQLVKKLSETVQAIRAIHLPVIASVRGAAIAGGCALAMSADYIIACNNSTFGYPVHRIGLSPAVTIGILESRISGGPLRNLLLGGEIINSDVAFRMGLVDEVVVNPEDLRARSVKLAQLMASYSSSAINSTYQWLNYLDKTNTGAVRKGEKGSLESCKGSWISDRLTSFLEKK